MLLRQIFDPQLAQYAYLVGCPRSGVALVIDPERDIDRYHAIAKENGLRIVAVAETHIHADFVSGSQEFARDPSINLYLSGEGGPDWIYQWPQGRANTNFLRDGDSFTVGNIKIQAILTAGHTPEHLSYLITDGGSGATEPIALATGDFLFMGDVGRPDLLESAAGMRNVMEPSARTLQASLSRRLSDYGDYLQILPAHGAGSACGKSLGAVPTTTLGYERRFNSPLKLALSNSESFVKDILQGQPDPPLYFATMKRVNRDGIAVTGGVPEVRQLDLASFKQLTSNPAVAIIDARDSKDDFHAAHIPGAISAPLHSPFFSSATGSYLSEHEQAVVIVERPQDSEVAARQLYRIGIEGLKGWILLEQLKSAGLCTQRSDVRDISTFNPNTAQSEGVIVDVRTSSEHHSGHLAGSISLPYTRLRERLNELPKNKRLFVHCASGKRASLASSFLAARGYDVVYLDGNFATCFRNTR